MNSMAAVSREDIANPVLLLLSAAADGDVKAANKAWKGLTGLLAPGAARKALKDVASGQSVAYCIDQGFYMVSAANGLPCDTDLLHKVCCERRDIASRLQVAEPNIVLGFDETLSIAFAEPLAEYGSYIQMPAAMARTNVLRHEIAHACLRSGNRLLDEGLADWIAGGGDVERPEAGECAAVMLRTALAADFKYDAYFDSIAPDPVQQKRLRADAALLVSQLHDRAGAEGLKSIFFSLAAGQTIDSIIVEIETLLGETLEKLCGIDSQQDAEQLQSICDSIYKAQLAGDAAGLSMASSRAFALAKTHAGWQAIDTGVVALLGAARLRIARGEEGQASTVAVADAWVAEAKQRGLPDSRVAALAAHRAILGVIAARREGLRARVVIGVRTAEKYLRQAIAADPEDLDAHATLAYLLNAVNGRQSAEPSESAQKLIDKHPKARAALSAAVSTVPIATFRNVTSNGGKDFLLHIEDLAIGTGERVALVGSNGSGKSTLIDAMLGLVPHQGALTMFGAAVGPRGLDSARRSRIGAVLNQAPLPRALKTAEACRLLDAVFGKADAEVYAAMSLEELADQPISSLSRGQYQRLMIYAGLGHTPDLLLLDEASLGLDAQHSAALRQLLFGQWGEGRTVLICSHLPHDLIKVDRVVVMRDGMVARQGSISELIRTLGWVWRGELQGVDAEACSGLVANLPDFQRQDVSGRTLVAYGGPRFGPAFSSFVASQPTTGHSLGMASIQDILKEGN